MVAESLSQKAASLSKSFHEGQVDKAGQPYWEHPVRVAELVQSSPAFQQFSKQEQEWAVQAAYLHDVVEDCSVSVDDLSGYGFSAEVCAVVSLLSKNVNKKNYVENIVGNKVARAVKFSDVSDNCNYARVEAAKKFGWSVKAGKYEKVVEAFNLSEAEKVWFESVIK